MPTTTVIWRRNACGIVESLEIRRGDELLLDTAAENPFDASERPSDTFDNLLWAARQFYKNDSDDDTLPPDHAVIAAWEYYFT